MPIFTTCWFGQGCSWPSMCPVSASTRSTSKIQCRSYPKSRLRSGQWPPKKPELGRLPRAAFEMIKGSSMDFALPEIGEGLYEAELVAWLVKSGERVKRGQTLMEVMTDKATMEVPSPFAGTVTELKAEPGQQI